MFSNLNVNTAELADQLMLVSYCLNCSASVLKMLSRFKIDQIHEKITGNWFFVGRCSFKSIRLNYSNQFNSGTYFYFYLQDASSEIKVILFNDNLKKFLT